MYIDSLTIAAMFVFVVALTVFIRFCIVGICGLASKGGHDDGVDNTHEKHS